MPPPPDTPVPPPLPLPSEAGAGDGVDLFADLEDVASLLDELDIEPSSEAVAEAVAEPVIGSVPESERAPEPDPTPTAAEPDEAVESYAAAESATAQPPDTSTTPSTDDTGTDETDADGIAADGTTADEANAEHIEDPWAEVLQTSSSEVPAVPAAPVAAAATTPWMDGTALPPATTAALVETEMSGQPGQPGQPTLLDQPAQPGQPEQPQPSPVEVASPATAPPAAVAPLPTAPVTTDGAIGAIVADASAGQPPLPTLQPAEPGPEAEGGRFHLRRLKGILSVEELTIVERLKQIGVNPLFLAIGIYATWYTVITALSYYSTGGGPDWFGRTCGTWVAAECGDPWQEWWVDLRIVAEVAWCTPWIGMVLVNPKVRQKSREIVDRLLLSDPDRAAALAATPSVRIRKLVFWFYVATYFTWGSYTHFDVRSFGLLGLMVLLPVYGLQGALIADTFSLFIALKPLIQHRASIIIEPFHPGGAAGIDEITSRLQAFAGVPVYFAIMMMVRSYMFLLLSGGGGEADSFRAMGEVFVAIFFLIVAIAVSMGPLFLISGSINDRKQELIKTLAERCGFANVSLTSMMDAPIDDRKVADMLLMERIQAIRPIDVRSVQIIVQKIAIPALLVIVRPLLGLL